MAKINIEKLNGKNDFALWRMNLKDILVRRGFDEPREWENK